MVAAVRTHHERKRGSRRSPEEIGLGCGFEETKELSENLQLLAHPIRLQILNVLSQNGGKVCVCDLEAAVPVKQPTISHHLKILRSAGLIDDERHGLWSYYSVRRDRLDELRQRICLSLDRLG